MEQFQALDSDAFRQIRATIRLVATDMDGTLTRHHQFTPELLQALIGLRDRGLPVILVTGRSAGWVSGLAHYLPVAGAIAENGGVFIGPPTQVPMLLPPLPPLTEHRQALQDLFYRLKATLPKIEASSDNQFRLTDWTFDIRDLSTADLAWLEQTCREAGWGFTYSTVQCHLFSARQTKAAGLQQVLTTYFPQIQPAQVLTIGDSPNDESLFNRQLFPHGVGVANIQHYWAHLHHHPSFVTQAEEVGGFLEISQQFTDPRTEA